MADTLVESAFRAEVELAARRACVVAVENTRDESAPGERLTVKGLGDMLTDAAALAWCVGVEVGLALAAKDPDAASALLAFYRDTILKGDPEAAEAPDPILNRLIGAINAPTEV